MDKFCGKCGSKTTPDAKFCSYCGTALERAPKEKSTTGGECEDIISALTDSAVELTALAITAHAAIVKGVIGAFTDGDKRRETAV